MKKKVLLFGMLVILCLLFLRIAPAEGSVDTILENNNQEFNTEKVNLEIKEPVEFAGETLAKNKNKRMDFEFPEGNLRLYFDLLNYSTFVDSVENLAEESKNAEGVGNEEEITGNLIRTFVKITSKIIGLENEDAVLENSSEQEIVNEAILEPPIQEAINEELQEELLNLSKEKVEALALESATEAENFDIVVDEKRVREEDEYKWGYEVKLKELKFFAKIEVTSDEALEIWDNTTIRVGSQLLSFADLAAQGYNIRLEAPALKMEVIKEVSENVTEGINITIEENAVIVEENATEENASIIEESSFLERKTSEKETTEETNVTIEENATSEIPAEESSFLERKTLEKETTKEEKASEKEEGKEKKESVVAIVTGTIVRGTISIIKNVFFVFTSITGRILNADLQYENKINVYIERDFTDNIEGINIGDIINLDPTLIEISKAIHLDENKSFVSDIYSAVYQLDGVWSEAINNGEYVRASFEQNLTKDNDITIYAKSNSSETSEIEVYSEDELVTKFENIKDEGWYKVYLTNLQEENDVFELKINGSVEFDYIVDPTQAITEEQAIDAYLDNVVAESNFTHLNISDVSPYESLILYYPFDGDQKDASNQNVKIHDWSNNNSDGTGVWTMTINNSINCIYGDCFQSNGNESLDGGYIQTAYNYSTQEASLSFWLNYKLSVNNVGFFVTTNLAPMVYDTSGKMVFRVDNSTADNTIMVTSPSVIPLNSWNFWAFTYNETGGYMYLNQILVASDIVVAGEYKNIGGGTAAQGIFIGNDRGSDGRSVNGSMDEVMVFNVSLTPAQISGIYNNLSARFKATGTQELYNQSYLNITAGNDCINVSATYEANFDSNISVFLGYYDDANDWAYTDAQNLTNDYINFTVLTTTTNLTLNFTFEAGNDTDPFYSPILKNVTFEYSVSPVTTDTTPPNINITHPENTTYSISSIDFNVSADENLGYCNFNISDGSSDYIMTINNTEANYTHIGLADAQYFVNFTCNDTSGNINNTESVWFVIDAVAPTITIIIPSNNANINESFVEFNVSTDGDTDWCGLSIDGDANETMTAFNSTYFNYTNSSIGDGSHTFIVNCNDSSSKLGVSSIYNFYADTTPPDISFAAPTPSDGSLQSNTDIYVNVSVSDTVSNISTFIDFDNSLMGWWRMDDIDASNNLVDYNGIYNATISGVVGQADGVLGRGLEFNNSGNVTTSAAVMPPDSSTISYGGWIKWANYSVGTPTYPISQTSASYDGYGIVEGTGAGGVSCNDGWSTTLGMPISINTWYHVFCVHNGTGMSLYVNGMYIDSIDSTETADDINFQIGSFMGTDLFNGTIDDVMVFNRSLSAAEIAALYANQTSRYLENNFTELLEGSHTFKAYSQDNLGNVNTTETRTVNIGIRLNTGWNLISLLMSNKDAGTDRTIYLSEGWNLIGYSSDTEIALENAKFANITELTWAQAVNNNNLTAYLQYFDGFNDTARQRKYKYTATADLGMDDTNFRRNYGYWVHADQAGNLTMPAVGGTLAGETYNWSELRFSNITDELDITDAGTEGWMDTAFDYLNAGSNIFRLINGVDNPPFSKSTISSWEGVWIYGYKNNLTLIRRN